MMKRRKLFLSLFVVILLGIIAVPVFAGAPVTSLTRSGNVATATSSRNPAARLAITMEIQNTTTGRAVHGPMTMSFAHQTTSLSMSCNGSFLAGRTTFSTHTNRDTGHFASRSLRR